MKFYKRMLPTLLIFALLFGCAKENIEKPKDNQSGGQDNKQEELQKPQETPKLEPTSVRLVAVGDNLIHNTISFASEVSGGYDFNPVYEQINPIIKNSDFAFINQEVPLGGSQLGIGKYPNLNAPQEVADALVNAGFNIVNEASNHALDKGKEGMLNTLEGWKSRNIPVIGAFSSEEDANKPCIIEKNGIKFGFVGYSYGTNGYPIPKDMPWLVSIIDKEKIAADMKVLREQCEYLVVSLHWGTEYQTSQSSEQEELAAFVSENGADLIIGHHPHVIQPMKWIERTDGGKTLCAYSLGNFVSSQNKNSTMVGGVLGLNILRDEYGNITTENAGILPIITHYERGGKNYKVIPLEDYTSELMNRHSLSRDSVPLTLEYCNNLAQKVLGEFYASKELFK